VKYNCLTKLFVKNKLKRLSITTINYDANPLLEITRKLPLAMSEFLFSGRQQS